MAEAGLNNAEAISSFVLVAPGRTPKEVIAALHAEIVKALARPDVRQHFFEFGVEPAGNSTEEAEVFLRKETAKWAKVVKDSGAKADNRKSPECARRSIGACLHHSDRSKRSMPCRAAWTSIRRHSQPWEKELAAAGWPGIADTFDRSEAGPAGV